MCKFTNLNEMNNGNVNELNGGLIVNGANASTLNE